jgi:hypothetical protein
MAHKSSSGVSFRFNQGGDIKHKLTRSNFGLSGVAVPSAKNDRLETTS